MGPLSPSQFWAQWPMKINASNLFAQKTASSIASILISKNSMNFKLLNHKRFYLKKFKLHTILFKNKILNYFSFFK